MTDFLRSRAIATRKAEERATLRKIEDGFDGQPRYEVVLDGEAIGKIVGYFPTFERRSKGRNYVNSRWRSKTRYWVADYPGAGNMYGLPCRTRKDAVHYVCSGHIANLDEQSEK